MTLRLPRRRFLQLAGASAVLAACGSDRSPSDAVSPSLTAVENRDESSSTLVALFSTDRVIAAGSPQRIPFAVFGPERTPRRDGLPATASVELARDGAVLQSVAVDLHGQGVPFPYYPMRVTLPEPGFYDLALQLDDGPARLVVQAFDPAEVSVPQPGQPLPSAPTPTVADPRGVDPLCTRFDPCPFHQRSLDEVLGVSPVALLVGTPAYCQMGVCGPALEQLIEVGDAFAGVTLIHAEVYANPAEVGGNLADPSLRLAPVTQALHLGYEPVIFLVGADGIITERLDNVFDSAELERALSDLV